jgi:hypothetical protein
MFLPFDTSSDFQRAQWGSCHQGIPTNQRPGYRYFRFSGFALGAAEHYRMEHADEKAPRFSLTVFLPLE